MIKMIQILFVVSIVVAAFTNASGILGNLVRWIGHPAPRTQRNDNFAMEDPGEFARRSVTGDPIDTLWDWDDSDIGDFIGFG